MEIENRGSKREQDRIEYQRAQTLEIWLRRRDFLRKRKLVQRLRSQRKLMKKKDWASEHEHNSIKTSYPLPKDLNSQMVIWERLNNCDF